MHLTLVISSLACGGAERAVTLLSEGFLKKGHDVFVITLAGEETDFYQLPSGVNRVALNIYKNSPTVVHALCNNLHRLWILRQAIQAIQPEVVISFLERVNIMTLLALVNTRRLIIVNEQNNPKMLNCGILWDKLRHLSYPYASKIVSTSQGVDSYFDWLPEIKRQVIYNPLATIKDAKDDQTIIDSLAGADREKNWIIGMGRLTYQKGFDLLLTAFQRIANKYPDWQLLIFGEGELRQELEASREKLGLTDQVLFPGVISNPFVVFKKSKLFVLSSRFEGFGNVLIEAMSCGIPVISTDCPSGPKEIIRDGIDGILVPNEDVSALASAMERLISDEEERKRLASRATEVTERFSLEKVIEMWTDLLREVILVRGK